MDKNAITFEILEEGEVIQGFSLTAIGETEAESFCYSFPQAVSKDWARVEIQEGKIIFTHNGTDITDPSVESHPLAASGAGIFEVTLAEEQACSLNDLLNTRGQYAGKELRVSYELAWRRGFKLVAQ